MLGVNKAQVVGGNLQSDYRHLCELYCLSHDDERESR